MSRRRVTITLGRSGQKVVKGSSVVPGGGARTNSQPLSGSKRSRNERFESNAAHSNSFFSTNKRLQGDVITRNAGYNGFNDARIGRNDLRLKLMHKRTSRRMRQEVEESLKMEPREKTPRNIQSPVGPERTMLRHVPPAKRDGDLLPVDSLRRSYASRTSDGLISQSPDRFQKASMEISPPRNVDQVQRGSSTRQIDASNTGRLLGSNFLQPSKPKDPAPITMKASLDAGMPANELPPERSSGPRSSNLGKQPVTVSSLLHSLGLGKYAIHFQAEEVDMAALKQMGDHDLKELGLPMGPRKKILLALPSLSKAKTTITTSYF